MEFLSFLWDWWTKTGQVSTWQLIVFGYAMLTIGFVLGAAWCGLGIKNREVDKCLKDKRKEYYGGI